MTRAADICTECRRPLGLTSDGLAVCSYRPCGEFGRSVDLQLSLDLEEASSAYMDYEDARARLRGAV
jgi:hypothetical protein